MKRIAVAFVVALLIIGTINSYATFPTFVWTEEYRSDLYAVEMEEETGVEEIVVFDTIEDEPATLTDLDSTPPDEGMNDAVDDENEPDSAAQSIATYDIEPTTAGEDDIEPVEAQEEKEAQEEQPTMDDTTIITDNKPDTTVEEHNIGPEEPEQEG